MKSVVQYYFLTRNGLTKMANINDKTAASMQKQLIKILYGTRPVHKFPFKVMVWAGIIFRGVNDIVILPQKTSFYAALKEMETCGLGPISPFNKTALNHTRVEQRSIQLKAWDFAYRVRYMATNSTGLNPLEYFFLGTRSKYS